MAAHTPHAGASRSRRSGERPTEMGVPAGGVALLALAAAALPLITRARAQALLDALRLAHVAGRLAGTLPHRDQKALALAMVLATGAELVILDEPMAGLAAQEKAETIQTLERLRVEGLTILLVEHDMKAVMGVCDTITVLDHGVRIAQGPPREIQANRAVIEAYLGS